MIKGCHVRRKRTWQSCTVYADIVYRLSVKIYDSFGNHFLFSAYNIGNNFNGGCRETGLVSSVRMRAQCDDLQ